VKELVEEQYAGKNSKVIMDINLLENRRAKLNSYSTIYVISA
jgi:hypothetical protein